MNFVVSSKVLDREVKILDTIIPVKTTMDILRMVLISADEKKNEVTFKGTDLGSSLNIVMDCKVLESGQCLIDIKTLKQILKKSKGDLRISYYESDDPTVRIILADETVFDIKTRDVAEFPMIPDNTENSALEFDINGKVLTDILGKIKQSVTTDLARPSLTGIYLSINDDRNAVVFNATDGHTLHRITAVAENLEFNSGKAFPEAIFTTDVYKVLKKIGKGLENVNIAVYEKEIEFKVISEFENITLITRIIAGPYPNVKNVIPTNNKIGIKMNRFDLLNSLNTMESFSNVLTHMIILETDCSEDELSLSITTKERGSVSKILPCETEIADTKSGTIFKVAFNCRYLIEALKVVSDEVFTLQLNPDNPSSSALLVNFEVSEGIKKHLYILMPMRLEED